MESHYEINVAFEGRHLFATAPRSLRDEQTAYRLLDTLREKFPAPAYQVTMTHWTVSGRRCE